MHGNIALRFYIALNARLRSKRGAYSEELILLIACAVGVAVVMGGYYRDSLRGLLRWAEILCNTLTGV